MNVKISDKFHKKRPPAGRFFEKRSAKNFMFNSGSKSGRQAGRYTGAHRSAPQ
jgi:hypothetical protein